MGRMGCTIPCGDHAMDGNAQRAAVRGQLDERAKYDAKRAFLSGPGPEGMRQLRSFEVMPSSAVGTTAPLNRRGF